MPAYIVVDNPRNWPLEIPGAEVVAAREYLTDRRFSDIRRARVYNMCRSYAYQTVGYYVSLLAAARGHKPLPSVTTIQDLRQSAVLRIVSEDLEHEVQKALGHLKSERFELSVYFGRNLAHRYDRLSAALFDHFPAPFLRAEFVYSDQWRLHALRSIAASDIPESHRPFVSEQAERYLARPRSPERTAAPRYEIAILVNPEEVDAPSDDKAIRRFVKAARDLGMAAWPIGREEYGSLATYDGLFIRETTQVNHHTYRFASRAAAEGMEVIDDPESIIRCTNKVYQAEVFERHGVAAPRTEVVHRDNVEGLGERLGFPVVLKRPDSSFSAGVVKAADEEELKQHLEDFFHKSELVVAQEFVPSSFDWRIGVLAGRALYACKYHMAKGHWQIQQAIDEKRRRYGSHETLPVERAPRGAVEVAVKAANIIGNGLYGVDVKEVDGRFLVMEVNDNPSIEAGVEDKVLGDELYRAIMRVFYERLEGRGREERS